MHTDRRSFLRTLSIGAAAGAAMTVPRIRPASAADERATVAFAAGTDRRELMHRVLEPFKDRIADEIQGKRVIIKPNNVWDGNPLCATHPDAVRGVLDFLKSIHDGRVIVAESTASPKGTSFTFEEYGYLPLEREYNARLFDLNTDTWQTKWICSTGRMPLDIKIISTFLDPDAYIISLARMKTHDSVVATLAFKNMLLASPINVREGHPDYVNNQFEKAKMHEGGPVGINYNMFLLAQHVRPSFAIIDGTVGMEGNGPTSGTAVEHGVAVGGPDVVAVDSVGIEVMGIPYEDVGYLQWCNNAGIGVGERDRITVLGPDPKDHVISYRLHDNIERQMQWKEGISGRS